MSTLHRNEKTDARRLIEAAAWRTHLTETSQESTIAFEAWIASPENHRAWQRVQQSWDIFAEQVTSPELLDLRRRALARARDAGRKRWIKGGLATGRRKIFAAASVAVLSVLGYLGWQFLSPDVYRTATGERRVVTLADGSQVQLDSLTELRVSYSKRARDLKLVKGQARFDVAHDVERPFSVLAAGRKVVALGTAFNVDMVGRVLTLTLIEGRVVILPQASSAATTMQTDRAVTRATVVPGKRTSVSLPRERAIELVAGQQLTVSANGNTQIETANVERTTAWQEGRLVIDNEPLSSVILRVNRYTTRSLSVADDGTGALRISGVFDSRDVDGFVSTITHYLPVEAETTADSIRLVHR